MFVERLTRWNGRVVVPRQKLSCDYFVDAHVFDPEVYRFLEFALDCVLPDDGNYDARGSAMLFSQFKRGADVADLPVPPHLRRLGHAATWRTKLCVKLGVASVHGKLDQ